ncbi:MAG: TRAP transporter small permease [Pseudomonadota bacterium]
MRFVTQIAAVWALVGGVFLIAIMAVTSVNAGAFLLDRLAALTGGNVAGLSGYEDFVSLAVACAAMTFLPYCQVRSGHIVVDLFANLLSPRLQRALDRLWLAATVALCVFLTYWMGVGLAEVRSDGVLSPILGWPVWPSYIPGILSLVLWGVVAAGQAFGAPGHD